MATIYSALGCKITIVEMLDEILPMMDRELTKIIRSRLEKQGVKILTGAKVLSLEDKGKLASVAVEHRNTSISLEAEKVLISTGRKINTEPLCLDIAGIQHEQGRILVNKRQETNSPGIYAVGDCTGGLMLAHVASMQGEIAAENALGGNISFDIKTNPSCIYTKPELAGVGLTEEQAKAKNLDYIIGRFPLSGNGKALIMGDTDGLIKIIAGKRYKEILGIHILGPRATDIIAEAAIAIGVEATLDEVASTIYAHPTVAEAVREAALAASSRAIHIPN
jgi:dihydrolipoamide dehydrogenase